MIAGPNGAGKTTAALSLLPDFLSVYEFVNADEIAKGLNPLNPYGQPIAAGRVMLQRIDELIVEKKSFAFEATGSGLMFTEKMKEAKKEGYRLGLLYLWLPNATMAKDRVRLRVAQGGHDVPAADIERRYKRSLVNLVNLYLPLVDECSIFDSTLPMTDISQLIAQKFDIEWKVYISEVWNEILKTAKG